MTFTPGANGKKGREYKVVKCHYPEEFITAEDNEAPRFDYGVMELGEDLGNKYGWIGIDRRKENTGRVEEVEICGYPGDKDTNTMWQARGPFRATDLFFKHRIPTTEGQSGSPIIKIKNGKEYVIGVHTGSNSKGNKNIAVRLTPENLDKINEWVGQILGDLELSR